MAISVDKKIIAKTVQTLNQHLPTKRRTLADLLEDEKPGIKSKDNTFFFIDRDELELLSKTIPRYLWSRLKLPLLIEMSPQFGSGAARIQGKVECELVGKLLKKSWDDGKFMIIYMPDVRELRRKLPTTTQYAFITSLR
jgi:uncharacterized protein (UPF0216 family)